MGRFNYADSDHYGTSAGTKWFSLKNDGDIARVRFMYNNIDDVEGYAVHKVKVDDKEVTVNCLRDYDDPIDKCPFCAARIPQKAAYYVPLYDEDTGSVKLWQRGKSYGSELASLCARYGKNGPLVNHIFEIERHGKAGDNKTTYKSFEVDSDDTTLADLDEVPEVLGSVVLEKSTDDMNYYLDNGVFPGEGNATVRRRESRDEERVARRTPSRNYTDRF